MRSNPRWIPLQAVLVVLSLALVPLDRADADRYRPDGSYDPSVPTPTEVLGFELGERPTRHAEIEAYLEALAEASPRASLEVYARSHEGRELFLLRVASEANQSRLDEIQARLKRFADPRISMSGSELNEIYANGPAVAYMAYAIHGDELSSADAALRVAYELVAGLSPDVVEILENAVVLIDPTENPDGRERILGMLTSWGSKVANPDPDNLAHDGLWPYGRGNHYLFDLNRDWFALVHPESRGRAAILREWRPQIVVDSHEMGSRETYLFSPPRDPFNPNLPRATLTWWNRFADEQAQAFDRFGWSYYTREWNEEFYPGYGSGLPLYQGALGILYEQAYTGGLPTRKPSDRIANYFESIHHQYTSSMANLSSLARHREEFLRHYRAARQEAIDRGRSAPARAFYFAPTPDPARAERLAERLQAVGIDVERTPDGGNLGGARNFWEDGASTVRLPPGSFRVRLDQPDGLLARAVLEPHTLMPDSSLAQEREHLERQKESRLYDVTAWSFLVASGVDAWWASSLDGLSWEITPRGFTPVPTVGTGDARYGWMFDGTTDEAVVLAAKLTARGFKVRASREPFVRDGRRYERGAFLLRAEDNPGDIAGAIRELTEGTHLEVIPLSSARIVDGWDLGGENWTLLAESRTAILAGPRLSTYSVGAAWHLLDGEFGLRASLIDATTLADQELERYNVLVFPNAYYGVEAYEQVIDAGGLRAVRNWIENGGTLIALGGAAEYAADSTIALSKVQVRSQSLEDFPPPSYGLDAESIRRVERMQGMGVDEAGKPVDSAGLYREIDRDEILKINGIGAPVLGPGTWAMLGAAGDAARRRGAPVPTSADGKDEKKSAPKLSDEEREARLKKRDDRLRRFEPSGALLRVDLDPEHWISYGCGDRVAVMLRRRDALLARDPVRTAARFASPGELHVGGLLWPEAAGRIAQTAYVTRESSKKGQVILFAYDPNFRGYFWGSRRLFLNAVVFGPGLGTERYVKW